MLRPAYLSRDLHALGIATLLVFPLCAITSASRLRFLLAFRLAADSFLNVLNFAAF
jgi:hypothetical protein